MARCHPFVELRVTPSLYRQQDCREFRRDAVIGTRMERIADEAICIGDLRKQLAEETANWERITGAVARVLQHA